jgi:transglutaminase-like putative cysteine protease
MKVICRTLLAAFLIAGSAPFATAQQPSRLPIGDAEIKDLLTTEYYGVYIQGKKVGWLREEISFSGGSDPAYGFRSDLTMNLLVAGARKERHVFSVEEFDSRSPYAFRGGMNRVTDGKVQCEIEIKRLKQGFQAIVRTDGKEFPKTFPAPDYTLADRVANLTWLRHGAKSGDSILTRGFSFEDLSIELTRNRLTATQQTRINGQSVPCREIETCKLGEKTIGLERYDLRNQRMLSASQPGLLEIRAEDEKIAKTIEAGPDLFEKTKIRTNRKLGEPTSISSLEIETVGARDLTLVNQPGQEIARCKSGEYVLKLGKLGPASVKADPQDIAAALKETTACPLTHPKVRELASRAVGNAKSPREKVERLVHFVARFVSYDITANPVTIEELIATRKGKCVDYAGLFAILARSEGIPTRIVSGFFYLGDREQAFAGHAWNDVALDGRWMAVDPTLDEVELDGAHIHLEESPFAAASRGLAALKVTKVEYAKQRYQGTRGKFALQLPQGNWRQMVQPTNPAAEVMFTHKTGEAFSMVIAEQHYIPLLHIPQTLSLADLKKAFLQNIRAVDPKAAILREQPKKILGRDAVTITVEANAFGQTYTYEVLLYSANATSIQVFTWTSQKRFSQLQPDLEAFLNGLIVPQS